MSFNDPMDTAAKIDKKLKWIKSRMSAHETLLGDHAARLDRHDNRFDDHEARIEELEVSDGLLDGDDEDTEGAIIEGIESALHSSNARECDCDDTVVGTPHVHVSADISLSDGFEIVMEEER